MKCDYLSWLCLTYKVSLLKQCSRHMGACAHTNTTKHLISDRTLYLDKSTIQEEKVGVTKSHTLTSKTLEVTKANLLEIY